MKDIAKCMAAVVNTDGTRMLGEFLEETSDIGLATHKVSAVKLKGFVFKCGKTITKCFRTGRLNSSWYYFGHCTSALA